VTAFRGADAVEQVIRGYTGSMGVSFLGVLDALGRGEACIQIGHRARSAAFRPFPLP
jgi:hypothetical protein